MGDRASLTVYDSPKVGGLTRNEGGFHDLVDLRGGGHRGDLRDGHDNNRDVRHSRGDGKKHNTDDNCYNNHLRHTLEDNKPELERNRQAHKRHNNLRNTPC